MGCFAAHFGRKHKGPIVFDRWRSLSGKADIRATVENWLLVTPTALRRPQLTRCKTINGCVTPATFA
jgi:hypothetical protein